MNYNVDWKQEVRLQPATMDKGLEKLISDNITFSNTNPPPVGELIYPEQEETTLTFEKMEHAISPIRDKLEQINNARLKLMIKRYPELYIEDIVALLKIRMRIAGISVSFIREYQHYDYGLRKIFYDMLTKRKDEN